MTQPLEPSLSFPFVLGALSSLIINVPGKKIVTIISNTGGIHQYDIEGEIIGYDATHPQTFMSYLAQSLRTEGGIIVRQFDKTQFCELDTPKGRRKVPMKNLFGIHCRQGQWSLLSAEALKVAFSTDPQTGKHLKHGPDIKYCNWNLENCLD